MIYTATERTTCNFTVLPPIFTPYYNVWGKNVYWQTTAFRHNPFTIDAASTSGSPVVIAGNKFFGFLHETGGTFAFDGKATLTVTLEPGQALLVDECCDPWTTMEAYNRRILADTSYTPEPFWSELEYCTWVEQTRTAQMTGSHNYAVFDEAFVYDYLRRVDKMGLPKVGKFTIDDGWAVLRNGQGQYLIGDWDIDRAKFPHFEKMIADIAAEGFKPGLWFAPFNISPDSRIGMAHPELLSTACFAANRNYVRCTPETEPVLHTYFRDLFAPFIEMGIKKLKLDISYGRKDEMIGLLRIIRDEVKKLDATVELETHIPDIFAARYADTVRMNDISIQANFNWLHVIAGHFQVCHYSSDRILNLDHIGGNGPQCSAKEFFNHMDMLMTYGKLHRSYPVISMLPDFYPVQIQEEFKARLKEFGY